MNTDNIDLIITNIGKIETYAHLFTNIDPKNCDLDGNIIIKIGIEINQSLINIKNALPDN